MAVVPSFIPGGDTVNTFVSNVLDGFEVGIETIRRVDYAAQYLWTIDFVDGPKPPAPFDGWFPASDIAFQSAISNNHTFEMGQTSFSIPRRSGAKTVDITFYDNESHDLQNWMSDWVEIDMYNGGKFVSGINDTHSTELSGRSPSSPSSGGVLENINNALGRSTAPPKGSRKVAVKRLIRIVLLDRFKDEAVVYRYGIVPNGEINVVGSQSSEASVFNVKFDIVEEFPTNVDKTLGAKRFVKTLVQRFI